MCYKCLGEEERFEAFAASSRPQLSRQYCNNVNQVRALFLSSASFFLFKALISIPFVERQPGRGRGTNLAVPQILDTQLLGDDGLGDVELRHAALEFLGGQLLQRARRRRSVRRLVVGRLVRAPDHGGRAGAGEGEVADDDEQREERRRAAARLSRHPGGRVGAGSNERKLTLNRAHGD